MIIARHNEKKIEPNRIIYSTFSDEKQQREEIKEIMTTFLHHDFNHCFELQRAGEDQLRERGVVENPN